ncbi:MAG: DUF2780 domain-containing protein [Alteromonadaceae bacterium]|nr:DUF2780 domain-containing protein [Alteromonadaceae bacterium]
MKKQLQLLCVFLTLVSFNSQAESWWDSLKGMLGLSEDTVAQTTSLPTASGMVEQVSSTLGLTKEQTEAGIASVLSFLQQHATSDQFSQLSDSLPGIDELMRSVPKIEDVKSDSVIGGLLDKAAQYSESAQSLSDLKKQLAAAGLDLDQLKPMLDSAKAYLDTPEGQAAKQQFEALSNSWLPKT